MKIEEKRHISVGGKQFEQELNYCYKLQCPEVAQYFSSAKNETEQNYQPRIQYHENILRNEEKKKKNKDIPRN